MNFDRDGESRFVTDYHYDALLLARTAANHHREPYVVLSGPRDFFVGPDRAYKARTRELICERVEPEKGARS